MIKKTKDEFISSEEYRVEVRFLLFNEQKYREGISLAQEWLNKINQGLETESNDMWAVYYYLGVGYWGINRFKTAVLHLNNSIQNANGYDRINSMTVLGLCYLGLNNKDLALQVYQNSLKQCDEIKNLICEERYINTKASLYHNIGEILNDEVYYFKSIELYNKLFDVDDANIGETIAKIDRNYKYLAELYISQNNYFKANSVLKNISSQDLVQSLKNKIRYEVYGEIAVTSIL